MPKTKIIATIGPASRSPQQISALIEAGVDVFRINCSHGNAEENAALVTQVREVIRKANRPVATLADLQGPKMRIGHIPQGINLSEGQIIVLRSHASETVDDRIPVDYEHLHQDVTTGDRILMCDGLIETEVLSVNNENVTVQVVQGGYLGSRKGVNLPGTGLKTRSPTEKDLTDLPLVLEAGADFIALSFVRSANDIVRLRAAMPPHKQDTPIIAKLERPEAIDNLEEILQEAYGVMVARGDLGIEIEPAMVPVVQKRIIQKANAFARPCIVATEMLESMLQKPRPTRAEVSDVANAILDGTDAVMLSGETAVGEYPVSAVQKLVRICELTEQEDGLIRSMPEPAGTATPGRAIAHAAVDVLNHLDASLVVAHTQTGRSARLVSSFRPKAQILALSPSKGTLRRLCLHHGVQAALVEPVTNQEELIRLANDMSVRTGLAVPGNQIVMISGTPGREGGTDRLLVHEVAEKREEKRDRTALSKIPIRTPISMGSL